MDARRQQVYNAIYKLEGNKLVAVLEEDTRIIDDVLEYAAGLDKEVIFVGDGVPVYKAKIETSLNIQ